MRYGFDFDPRADPADRSFRMRYGSDYGSPSWRWPPAEGGWSRPEFNVSLGAYGALDDETRPFMRRGATGDFPATGRSGRAGQRGGRSHFEAPGGGSTPVREVMTEHPEAVTRDTPLAEVAKRMRDLDVGIIPVVADLDSYVLQGVITDRDIVVRAAADGTDLKKARVGDFMSTRVESVGESATIRDVFTVMKRDRVRRVPVTDRSGKLVGIIAQADLAVDYAGLDLEREAEVEEVLERISEPARPRSPMSRSQAREWGFGDRQWPGREYDTDFRDRMREGWRSLKREARHFLDRGYDSRWR